MSNFGTITGSFPDLRTGGVSTVPSPLGTLSSTVALDRGQPSAGPTPTDNGDGTWSLDLTSYSGQNINVIVRSTLSYAYPYVYSNAVVDPLPIYNITDFADGLHGRRCWRTGLWVPRSRLKFLKGIPFWDIVAPEVYNQPLPNPPGIQVTSPIQPPTTGPYNNGD